MVGRSGFHAGTRIQFITKGPGRQSRLLIAAAAIAAAGYCRADTPVTARVPEETYKRIECSAAARGVTCGTIRIKVTPGVYHYRVWLPKGYHREKICRPALFIAAPDGNAGMDNVARFAAERRWIVIMLDESYNNSPPGMAEGCFIAAHDDAVKRFRIQEGMKFVTGFSGGARRQSLNAGLRPGFGGMILQGAGFIQKPGGTDYRQEALQCYPELGVYALFGTRDQNRQEAGVIGAWLPENTVLRIAEFRGGHEWAPSATMERALNWISAHALRHLEFSDGNMEFLNAELAAAIEAASGRDRVKGFFRLEDMMNSLAEREAGKYPALRNQWRRAEDLLKTMKQESAIRQEVAARKEYEAIASDESAAMAQLKIFNITVPKGVVMIPADRNARRLSNLNGKNNPPDFASLARRYLDCARKHSDTCYGRMASDQYQALTSIPSAKTHR